MKAKIVLENGIAIDNMEVNGDCFVSKKKVEYDEFTDDMKIKIEYDDGTTKEFTHAYCCLNGKLNNSKEYYLAFAEKTKEELHDTELENTATDMQMAIAELYEMLIGGNA